MDRNTLSLLFLSGAGVALRKESVDRNLSGAGSLTMLGGSLSARRAWIEIVHAGGHRHFEFVALRKESVDRNRACILTILICIGRSPQGERG